MPTYVKIVIAVPSTIKMMTNSRALTVIFAGQKIVPFKENAGQTNSVSNESRVFFGWTHPNNSLSNISDCCLVIQIQTPFVS